MGIELEDIQPICDLVKEMMKANPPVVKPLTRDEEAELITALLEIDENNQNLNVPFGYAIS